MIQGQKSKCRISNTGLGKVKELNYKYDRNNVLILRDYVQLYIKIFEI